MTCASFVDDSEHYGADAQHLPTIMQELGDGGMAMGSGSLGKKNTAFATDWSQYASTPDGAAGGLTADRIYVEGWNIWTGCRTASEVPRAWEDTPEKLLGKRGR